MAPGRRNQRLRTENFRFINTSEAIQSIDYSGELRILEVQFINGGIYHYLDTGRDVWKKIQSVIESGESLGAYINEEIKPNHKYYDLNAPAL